MLSFTSWLDKLNGREAGLVELDRVRFPCQQIKGWLLWNIISLQIIVFDWKDRQKQPDMKGFPEILRHQATPMRLPSWLASEIIAENCTCLVLWMSNTIYNFHGHLKKCLWAFIHLPVGASSYQVFLFSLVWIRQRAESHNHNTFVWCQWSFMPAFYIDTLANCASSISLGTGNGQV